ncbi:septum formation family protein [Allorhizocola rhizosphaerae]|uniref:septum formation family protein n=1 Tax=Allorhizocola rhizosphaerae TaxID=1872709 RepID=UPI000E3CFF37|nr:septum formation family protein [Allorhizocola rhizosphaerae]
MRIGLAFTMAVAALLTLAACTQATPPITIGDGRLTNQWPALPEPVSWRPAAGTCHQSFLANLHRTAYEPVDCAAQHQYETVHVGDFVPEVKEPAHQQAWADCDAKTAAFLGGQWRDRQIWIGVSLPSPEAWSGGARWYACQAGAASWVGHPKITFVGSIRQGFDSLPNLRWGCGQQPEHGEYQPLECDQPHNSEFAGTFPLDVPFAEVEAKYADNDPLFHQGCLKVIAKFIGVRDEQALASRTGSSYWLPDESDWTAGDRSVRCHLWTGSRQVTRSLEGAGAAALPTR